MPDIFIEVKIEGIDVTTLLSKLVISEFDDRASKAEISFLDSDLILSDIFHEGLSLDVDIGYQDSHGVVFRGLITSLRALFSVRGQARVDVTGLNNLIQMSFEAKTKRWWNTTLSQVVRELALAQRFVPGSVAPGVDPLFSDTEPLQQVEETDLSFLYRLANAYGCKTRLVHSSGPDQLNFESVASLLAQKPLPQPMRFNHNLLDFYVGVDAYETSVSSEVVTTDPLSGETVELLNEHINASQAQWTPDPERVARLGQGAAFVTALVAASAAKRATISDFWRKSARYIGAASRSNSQSGMFGNPTAPLGQIGKGRATGNFQVRPQKRVLLEEVGGRWSGEWYVKSCRHSLDIRRNSYLTEFECTR